VPNGWGGLNCAPYTGGGPTPADPGCAVAKSRAVVGWCYAGIVIVALAFVAGASVGVGNRMRPKVCV